MNLWVVRRKQRSLWGAVLCVWPTVVCSAFSLDSTPASLWSQMGEERPASLQSEMQCLFLLLCLQLHRKTTGNSLCLPWTGRNLAAASGLERRAATPPQMCAEATAQSVGEVLLFTENKKINSSTKIDKSRPGEYGRIRVDLVRFSCGRREFFVEKRSLSRETCQKFQRSIHQL